MTTMKHFPHSQNEFHRLVLSLIASHRWEVHQIDLKYAFLHGDPQEEIYMEQPDVYVHNDSSLVCRLKKNSMVLSKLLDLGVLKWIAFFLRPVFLDFIMTPMPIQIK
jgi:hypothetical protein